MSEKSSTEDLSQIPMADEEIDSDELAERNNLSTSNSTPRSNGVGHDGDDFQPSNLSMSPPMSLLDTDLTQEEQEEKARLIAQVTKRKKLVLTWCLVPNVKFPELVSNIFVSNLLNLNLRNFWIVKEQKRYLSCVMLSRHAAFFCWLAARRSSYKRNSVAT